MGTKNRPFSILLLFMFITCQIVAQDFGDFSPELKFSEVLSLIRNNYLDTINAEALTESAIKAMLKDLDPHSTYIAAKDVKKNMEPLEGSFDGVGINYQNINDTVCILSVVPDGPADKAGMQGGDKILFIDGLEAFGKHAADGFITGHLRGKRGSKVVVTILRNPGKEIMEFEIERGKIPILSLDAAFMLKGDIGYLKLNRFSANTANEFRKGIKRLSKEGMGSLILDLRGNTGGYLNSATEVVDEMLDGEKLIVYTEGINSPEQKYYAKKSGSFEQGLLLVLIDESTASASEIFAGAIQDWDRGVIAGRRSYGKGLVQKPYYLSDGSMIRLTTARYHTPSGRCVQRPYNEGVDKYFNELNKRKQFPALTEPDSINFPDSLMFRTMGGRLVYGGGGIMPDVFIPADTLNNINFYREILKKNLLTRFTTIYLDENRKSLRGLYKDGNDFIERFSVDTALLSEFYNYLSKTEIRPDSASRLLAEPLIRCQIKANICREIYDRESYYRILSEEDKGLDRALELMEAKDVFNVLIGTEKKHDNND